MGAFHVMFLLLFKMNNFKTIITVLKVMFFVALLDIVLE